AGNDVDRHPKHEHDNDRPPDEARQLPVPAMEERVDLLVDLAIELVAIAIVGRWPIWFERHGRSPFLFYVGSLERENVLAFACYWLLLSLVPSRVSGESIPTILPSWSALKIIGKRARWFWSDRSTE